MHPRTHPRPHPRPRPPTHTRTCTCVNVLWLCNRNESDTRLHALKQKGSRGLGCCLFLLLFFLHLSFLWLFSVMGYRSSLSFACLFCFACAFHLGSFRRCSRSFVRSSAVCLFLPSPLSFPWPFAAGIDIDGHTLVRPVMHCSNMLIQIQE